jgi:hypothetical protein
MPPDDTVLATLKLKNPCKITILGERQSTIMAAQSAEQLGLSDDEEEDEKKAPGEEQSEFAMTAYERMLKAASDARTRLGNQIHERRRVAAEQERESARERRQRELDAERKEREEMDSHEWYANPSLFMQKVISSGMVCF